MSVDDQVLIRPAAPTDAEAIAEIHVAAWRVAYEGIVPSDHLRRLSIDKRRAGWLSAIGRGEPRVRVANRNDRVLGWVAFAKCRDADAPADRSEIWALYVAPDHWGQGIGYALLSIAVDELRDGGFKSASLWVLTGNKRARDFYARAGFTPDFPSGRTVDIGGSELEELRYVRSL